MMRLDILFLVSLDSILRIPGTGWFWAFIPIPLKNLAADLVLIFLSCSDIGSGSARMYSPLLSSGHRVFLVVMLQPNCVLSSRTRRMSLLSVTQRSWPTVIRVPIGKTWNNANILSHAAVPLLFYGVHPLPSFRLFSIGVASFWNIAAAVAFDGPAEFNLPFTNLRGYSEIAETTSSSSPSIFSPTNRRKYSRIRSEADCREATRCCDKGTVPEYRESGRSSHGPGHVVLSYRLPGRHSTHQDGLLRYLLYPYYFG